MWEEILKTALGNGLWAVLFCVLLMYQLRDGRARENKYAQIIDSLVNSLNTLEKVEKCVTETLNIVKKKEKRSPEKTKTEAVSTEVLSV